MSRAIGRYSDITHHFCVVQQHSGPPGHYEYLALLILILRLYNSNQSFWIKGGTMGMIAGHITFIKFPE